MIRCVIPSGISLPSPNPVSARSSFANVKPDLSLWRSWRKHQLADGVEDNLKLGVVFVFEGGQLASEIRVRKKQLAQAYKCTHDGDVDLHGAFAIEKTLDNMATPCSVNAYGRWRRPPRPFDL